LTTLSIEQLVREPAVLDHQLGPHFDVLSRLSSTKELERHPLYKQLKPDIERVLDTVAQEDFAPSTHAQSDRNSPIFAAAWNIERGIRLEGIIRAFQRNADLRRSDVFLLTELDYGMARTGNRFIAREMAESLAMNYAFAPSYINLAKGSGLEARAAGDNDHALHGNAILARYPLLRAHSIRLPNGKDKMRGKEKRLGSQRAVVADLDHPGGMLRVVSVHLDAHSTQLHRARQMRIILDHLDRLSPALPVLIGGDWNTTTYNSKRATYAIAGFFRRVMMGVSYFLDNHYLYPDRWFERHLFRELERRGYGFRDINQLGVGTLHYDVRDLSHNTNMGDWVPQWCFWFLNKALEKHNGRASLKLDWFAAKGVERHPDCPPVVIGGLADDGPLSDHDPIVVGLRMRGPDN
jgi:endonuclease/exonuclease/phosphatase family metal-dependent hydrolase